MIARHVLTAVVAALALAGSAAAADLFKPGAGPSLASDPKAAAVGDSLTVLVIENASASNATQNGASKGTRFSGQVAYGRESEAASLAIDGKSEGSGQTGRSGRMVAQIGVTVDEVLPNGDLRVSGEHTLKINGEVTTIKLHGRVRRIDIGGDNTVVSGRLADASIEYDGQGFLARSAKPGVVTQILSLLGLL